MTDKSGYNKYVNSITKKGLLSFGYQPFQNDESETKISTSHLKSENLRLSEFATQV